MKMNRRKNLQLNEEPVVNCVNTVVKHQKEENGMKKTRNYVALLTSIIMVLSIMVGCSNTQASTGGVTPSTSIGSSVEPTVQAPTEVVAQPTEEATPTEAVVEATPTEEAVEDNPNIIDGVDFTKYNEGEPIDVVLMDMQFDEPKLIVERKVQIANSGTLISDAMGVLSNGDKYVEEPVEEKPEGYEQTYFVYNIYAPKPIKNVSYNEREIEVDNNNDGYLTKRDHVYPDSFDEMEMDGIQYPKLYYFYMVPKGILTDDDVTVTIEYEDGTSDQITVYITKEYVEYWH